jgi:hypothetical protein
LKAIQGQLLMADTAAVRTTGGSITVQASGDLVVGELNASNGSSAKVGGVALDSASGVIRASSSNRGLINAQTVSMYGYGPKVSNLSSSISAVQVQAEQFQVSAPSGVVVRDSGADGETYYTLINRNNYYRQATIMGSAPMNVMVDKSQLAGTPQTALPMVSQAVASTPMSYARSAIAYKVQATPSAAPPLQSVRSYLAGAMQISPQLSLPLSAAPSVSVSYGQRPMQSTTDLLSDLSYGLTEDTAAGFVMGSSGVQTTSTGVQATPVLTFDYEA